MRKRHVYRFLEFFLVGFIMGVTEDIIAIHYATDAQITPHVILVAAIVALPFAAFSELLVDWKHIRFLRDLWEKNLAPPKKRKLIKQKRKTKRRR